MAKSIFQIGIRRALPEKSVRWVVLVAAVLFSANNAFAQSLFDRRDPRLVDPYSNIVAHRKGDLLQIVISENTDVDNRDQRSMDKAGSSSVDASLSYGLGGDLGSGSGDGSFGEATSSTRKFNGDTEFRSERQFTDRFMVTVIDVMPNGNLIVAGKRFVSLHDDTRLLQLTGVVREVDVINGNRVSSQSIANLEIKLVATGAEQAFGRQGWFSRKMNHLWPF
jgi:flagellar L-ring protein precursor FlgH